MRWGKCNTLRGYEPPTGSPTLWAREGCPEEFEITLDSSYEGGEEVEFDGNVYECTAPDPARCNQAGYEPSVGQYWEEAWTMMGRCIGTIAPTDFPTASPVAIWDKTGCPEAYNSTDESYEDGSEVSVDDMVYKCKPYPEEGFCIVHSPDSQYGYLGWESLGSCSGTLSPTVSPGGGSGCPTAFDASTAYAAGDSVSVNSNIYECKSWPNSLRCSQAGFEPGTSQHWSMAWEMVGSCAGSKIFT